MTYYNPARELLAKRAEADVVYADQIEAVMAAVTYDETERMMIATVPEGNYRFGAKSLTAVDDDKKAELLDQLRFRVVRHFRKLHTGELDA